MQCISDLGAAVDRGAWQIVGGSPDSGPRPGTQLPSQGGFHGQGLRFAAGGREGRGAGSEIGERAAPIYNRSKNRGAIDGKREGRRGAAADE